MKRTIIATASLIVALTVSVSAQSFGPDVIVGDLHEVGNYAHVGNIDAFAVGTTSCNIGTVNLNWFANTNQKPVIGQTCYRIMNGRCEMIGQSWLKHGFFALSQTLCGACPNPTNGSTLGVLCSDPYSAGLNGQQDNLGPKFEVDAFTGAYPYPAFNLFNTGNSIYKRLQIDMADLDPVANAGAVYVVEGQYVTPDDASSGNGFNNASWRRVQFAASGGGYSMSLFPGSATTPQQPAVFAWTAFDTGVQTETINVPNEGRFNVLFKSTDNGNGTFTYEYAVHNLNSHRSARAFSLNLTPGATVTNIGFHDVAYHSGELWDGTDWTSSVANNVLTWSTSTFAANANANALRWGTTYNFRFTSDLPPLTGSIELFRPGTPTTMPVTLGAPAFTLAVPTLPAAELAANTPVNVDVQVTPLAGLPNSSQARFYWSIDGAPYQNAVMADLGGNLYRGTIPALQPYNHVDWYVGIRPIGSTTEIRLPANAPTTFFSSDAFADLVTIFSDDFETNKGWSIVNGGTLTAGAWSRTIPANPGSLGAPTTDADGSGNCFVTGPALGEDVDGGITLITSPVFDLGLMTDGLIEYSFWYSNDLGANGNQDAMTVELTGDGVNWTVVDNITANTNQWNFRRIRVTDHTFPSGSMQVRVTASDLFLDANVEAAFDAFRVRTLLPLNENFAAGNFGVSMGGPFDILKVNNSAGGIARHVVAPFGSPLTFGMDQPPTTAAPLFFAILGQIFLPFPGDEQLIPTIGTTALIPCFFAPNNPNLFMLTNNFPINVGCQQIMGSTLTPWSFTFGPGIPFPFVFTLQGIIIDPSAPSSLAITNAVIYETR